VKETCDLHPRQLKQDLEKSMAGISCWFSETPDEMPLDSMCMLIRNARLVIVCMSNDFAADSRCCELFAYTKQIGGGGQYLIVTLGDSLDWQKSQVGALITHELFIKINNRERLVFRSISHTKKI
jgi:hypothetical protein